MQKISKQPTVGMASTEGHCRYQQSAQTFPGSGLETHGLGRQQHNQQIRAREQQQSSRSWMTRDQVNIMGNSNGKMRTKTAFMC